MKKKTLQLKWLVIKLINSVWIYTHQPFCFHMWLFFMNAEYSNQKIIFYIKMYIIYN